MTVIAIDTSVLLDHFLDRSGAKRLERLIQQGKVGEVELYTPTPVVLECEWVLRSVYKLPKSEIVLYLEGTLALNTYSTPHADDLRQALKLFVTHSVSLDDCLIVVLARSAGAELATSDRKLATLFRKLR